MVVIGVLPLYQSLDGIGLYVLKKYVFFEVKYLRASGGKAELHFRH